MSTTYPSDLTDAEWEFAQRYLPPLPQRGRPRIHSLRRILDAIFYILRTGCAWRYLPSNFPPWQTVFYHFRRFRLKGTWHLVYSALHRAERERVGRNPEPSAAIVDAQSVKTVEESAGISGYGARKLLGGLSCFVPRLKKIWADAAYRGKELADWCQQQGDGWDLEVVKREPGTRGFSIQPRRWIVERSFAWLIRNRRLAKDYERRVQTSETLIELAATRLVLRRLAAT
jgi:putative transposase